MDDVLQAYLTRVNALKTAQDRALSAEDLRAIAADLRNDGRTEISRLLVETALLGEHDAPLARWTTEVVGSQTAVLRPGDQPMTFLKSDPIAVGQFEIRNKGAAIRTLRLEMALLDPAGKRLGGHDRLVVTGEGMELRPGETRLSRWYVKVPKGFSRYAMRVLDAE